MLTLSLKDQSFIDKLYNNRRKLKRKLRLYSIGMIGTNRSRPQSYRRITSSKLYMDTSYISFMDGVLFYTCDGSSSYHITVKRKTLNRMLGNR